LNPLAPACPAGQPLNATSRPTPLQLLQASLLAFPDDLVRLRALGEQVPRWDEYFDLAERHGVAGLLERALRQSGYVLPAAERTAVERRVAAGRLVQKSQHQGMQRVLEALAGAGLEVVALKGPVLAERLYGDPSLRFSYDLDLLIWPRDLEAVSQCLGALGYQPRGGPTARYERAHTHNLSFDHARFPMVEIHIHLLVDFGVTIRAEDFLSRSRVWQTTAGSRCRVLGPEDEAFYLLLHAVHHEFARFCWLYDIWTFLRLHPDLDWDEVFRRAEKHGVREPVCYAVELLRRRLGLPCHIPRGSFPRRVRQGLASLLLRLYDMFTPLDSPSTLVNLFFKAVLCDRPSASFRLLSHNLWRMTRRRLRRYLPRFVPEEWSG
jgi:hypothetical protein